MKNFDLAALMSENLNKPSNQEIFKSASKIEKRAYGVEPKEKVEVAEVEPESTEEDMVESDVEEDGDDEEDMSECNKMSLLLTAYDCLEKACCDELASQVLLALDEVVEKLKSQDKLTVSAAKKNNKKKLSPKSTDKSSKEESKSSKESKTSKDSKDSKNSEESKESKNTSKNSKKVSKAQDQKSSELMAKINAAVPPELKSKFNWTDFDLDDSELEAKVQTNKQDDKAISNMVSKLDSSSGGLLPNYLKNQLKKLDPSISDIHVIELKV